MLFTSDDDDDDDSVQCQVEYTSTAKQQQSLEPTGKCSKSF